MNNNISNFIFDVLPFPKKTIALLKNLQRYHRSCDMTILLFHVVNLILLKPTLFITNFKIISEIQTLEGIGEPHFHIQPSYRLLISFTTRIPIKRRLLRQKKPYDEAKMIELGWMLLNLSKILQTKREKNHKINIRS